MFLMRRRAIVLCPVMRLQCRTRYTIIANAYSDI